MPTLEGDPTPLTLKTLWGNQALDLRCFGVVLLALADDCTADNNLSDIVLLIEAEEPADLGGTLRAKSLRLNHIRETRKFAFTLFDNAKRENAEIVASDRWIFALGRNNSNRG